MLSKYSKKFVISLPLEIKSILKKINTNGKGLIFVINKNNKLIGSISDGDIRRYLIKHKKFLKKKIDENSKLINSKTFFLNFNSKIQNILKYLTKKNSVKAIPLVNGKKQVVEISTLEKVKEYSISSTSLGTTELKNVLHCVENGWISSKGSFVSEFENKFLSLLNSKNKFAISTSSGTSALELAIKTLSLKPDDEILVPNFTFAASINAIINAGVKPKLIDIDKSTWTISVEEILKNINKKTKAILVVNIFGLIANYKKIKSIAKKNNLKIIFDNAESLGAKFNGKFLRPLGDFDCYSFFANKIITTGEGGMLVTSNKNFFDKANKIKNHGMSLSKQYWHEEIGSNYRMTNLQAAVGLGQLKKINFFLSKRKKIFQVYNQFFKSKKNIFFLPKQNKYENSYWFYVIGVKNELIRNKILKKLNSHGIDARPGFYPLNSMPIYKKYSYNNKFKNTNDIANKLIILPTKNDLSFNDQKYISKTFLKYLKINCEKY